MRCHIKDCRERGFTLVEMAMVTIFIGIVVAAAAPLYSAHMKRKAMEATQQNIEDVSTAIGNFRTIYGRYPCPASLTDPRDSVDYGHEPKPPSARPQCSDQSQAIGSCVNGVCVQESVRDIDPNPPVDRPRVRVGWVPFRELGISEDQAFDAYGNRLTYAVTERLAVDTTFVTGGGGIEVRETQGQTALGAGAEGSAHFILFSHGRNGAGAFTKDGVQLPCAAAGSFEESNSTCAIAPGAAASVFSMVRGDASLGNSGFDDEVTYFTKEEVPLWQTSTVDANDIHVKTAGEVGIYVGAASNVTDKFSISGDVQIDDDLTTAPDPLVGPPDCNNGEEGCLLTTQILDPASGRGYAARQIAGSLASGGGMSCPAGQYMAAIRDGNPVCVDEVALAMCPPGEVMSGIAADGTLECSGPPVVCPSQVVGICTTRLAGVTGTLPQAISGASASVSGGDSHIDHYYCNAGTWEFDYEEGHCTCVPFSETRTGNFCDFGYTGTITQQWTMTCPGRVLTVTTTSGTCTCDTGLYQQNVWGCTTGFNRGDRRIRRDWDCSLTPPGWAYSAMNSDGWYIDVAAGGDSCRCEATAPTTQTLSCPGNLTGTGIVQQNQFVCPGGPASPGNWTGWVTTSTDCNCVDGREETWVDNTACPSGETGSVTYTRTLSCPDETWSAPVEVARDCTPLPPQVCKWTSNGSGQSGQTVGLGQRRGDTCACGTGSAPCYSGGGPYTNYAVCTCQ